MVDTYTPHIQLDSSVINGTDFEVVGLGSNSIGGQCVTVNMILFSYNVYM